MEPLAIDLLLLRSAATADLRIAPGRVLMARVVAAELEGKGMLSIAGQLVEASLPEHVQPGEQLRLVVRELSGERVVLGLAQDQSPPVVALLDVPLPGGGRIAITERDAAEQHSGSGGQGTHALTIHYQAPSLGGIDLAFSLDPASLRVSVTLAAGQPYDAATAKASELQAALTAAVARPVTVTVTPRREPVDLYA